MPNSKNKIRIILNIYFLSECFVGEADCAVTSVTASQIQCTLSSHAPGAVNVRFYDTTNGYSDSNTVFTYRLGLSDISPVEGICHKI